MSRKHFVQLARAVASIVDPVNRRQVAELLADVCAAANPRFNRSRFFAACGVLP
jgi:hypothetical protein